MALQLDYLEEFAMKALSWILSRPLILGCAVQLSTNRVDMKCSSQVLISSKKSWHHPDLAVCSLLHWQPFHWFEATQMNQAISWFTKYQEFSFFCACHIYTHTTMIYCFGNIPPVHFSPLNFKMSCCTSPWRKCVLWHYRWLFPFLYNGFI